MKTEDGLWVLVSAEGGSGGDAMVAGQVVRVGSCVGIERDGFTHVTVWPKGSTVSDGELTLPGGVTVVLGADVSGGGEYLTDGLPAGVGEAPEDCVGTSDEVVILAEVVVV